MKDNFKLIKYPLATEKAVRLMESENKLIFIVHLNSNKSQIKKAIEDMFKVKITKINTLITNDGRKKAYVTLSAQTPAIDIATQLGLM